ncbi:MAG: hypothetical protein K1X65_03270 [Caldilineales bacterium]|nr:hypothetical protein [Caldilineales bacterium]
MTWIRFGPHEPAAPALADALDLRGRASQVVFFGHGPGCPRCAQLVGRLAAHQATWAELGAEIVLVSSPANAPASAPASAPLSGHSLSDRDGRLRSRYARLLEFDTTGCLFLFVLDQHGAPFAAWVGQEAPESDLVVEAANWLAFAERQCPE